MQLPAEDSFKLAVGSAGDKVPPAVVVLELDGYRGPGDQLTRCVRASVVLNPLLRALAVAGGGSSTDVVLRAGRGGALSQVADQMVPRRKVRRPCLVRTGARRWELDLGGGVELGGEVFAVAGQVAGLTPAQALSVAVAARSSRLAVVERGVPGSMARCWSDTSVTTTAAATAWPGLVEVRQGGGQVRQVDAAGALALFDGADDDVLVVFDDDVADAAVAAGAGPRGRPGLREVQDLFVERYSAASRGMVLALAPGMGKTVCCAAALAELSGTGRGRTALCVVPARLVEQWRGELARWHPDAQVVGVDDPVPARGPVVVLDTVDRVAARVADGRLARHWAGRSLDDLVVDEANLLATGSGRARALWSLRAAARRGLAMTGTPAQAGDAGVGVLLGWALGTSPVLPAAGEPVARWAGPFVLADDGDGALPSVRREVLEVPGAGAASVAALAGCWEQLQHAGRGGLDPDGRRLRSEAAKVRLALLDELDRLRRAEALACVGGAVALAGAEAQRGGASLLFCDSLAVAGALGDELARAGVPARTLGGPDDARRFADGELGALVVTGAGQRGWNLQRASLVVHVELPLRRGQARQRLGRAVRLGGCAEVVEVFVCPEGSPLLAAAHEVAAGVDPGPMAVAAQVATGAGSGAGH